MMAMRTHRCLGIARRSRTVVADRAGDLGRGRVGRAGGRVATSGFLLGHVTDSGSLVLRDDRLGAVARADEHRGRVADGLAAGRVAQHLHAPIRHAVDVVGLAQNAGFAVFDDLRQATDARSDDDDLARHRLERSHAEAFLDGRRQEQVGDRQPRHQVQLLSEERDAVREAEVRDLPFGRAAVRAVADHDEPRVVPALDALERVHHHRHAFDRPEVRHVDDDGALVVATVQPRAQRRVGRAPVGLAAQEIRDHADVTRHAEQSRSSAVAGFSENRRDAVRLIDGERHDARVGRVAADERDIRPMERRHRARCLHRARRC